MRPGSSVCHDAYGVTNSVVSPDGYLNDADIKHLERFCCLFKRAPKFLQGTNNQIQGGLFFNGIESHQNIR